ncbi:MAG TPA: PhnD/SsuA/transferrin family substrate-binding protein [Planctomycetota bacterium]
MYAPRPVRIADLPWYDLEEVEAATDAWWSGIARHLRRLGVDRVPDTLTRRGSHVERWEHPDLLLSQACGYDVLYDHAAVLVPLASPCYAAAGCQGPRYSSVVVVRAGLAVTSLAALRGTRVVVNEASSHSGTNALRPLIAPLSAGGEFFADVQVSGSHTDSLRALRQGRADVACVDAVVMELLRRVRPDALRGIRVLATTAPALAPPYVTSVHADAALRQCLRQALQAAIADPALAECRNALLLTDFVFAPEGAYRELATFEVGALAAGYHELPAPRTSPLHRNGVATGGQRRSCAAPREAH